MKSKRAFLVALLAILGAIILQALVFAQAATPKKVPFVGDLSADHFRFDTKQTPATMTYDGHVKLISPVNNTSITCDQLKTNAVSRDEITSIDASGHVKFSVTTVDKATGKPNYRFEGAGELVQYSLVGTAPIVHMAKVNGVAPRLTMTDLASNKQTIFSGEEIDYNLESGVIEGKMVNLHNQENGQ